MTTIHGGFTATNVCSEIINSNLITVYDFQSNTFSHNTPLLESFDDHLFLLAEDKIFVLGGRVELCGADEPTSRMHIGVFEK